MTPTPLRRLLRLAAPVRGWLLLALLASFGALAANIALMSAAPYLISRATLVSGFAALSVAVTAVRAFAIARVGLRYSERYFVHLAALRVLTEIRVWLFRAIEPLAPGGLGGFRSGDLLARTVADVDTLDAFFVRGLVPPVAAVLAVVFGCVVLAAFEPGACPRPARVPRDRWTRGAAGDAPPRPSPLRAVDRSPRGAACGFDERSVGAGGPDGVRARGEAGRGPDGVVAGDRGRAPRPRVDPGGRRRGRRDPGRSGGARGARARDPRGPRTGGSRGCSSPRCRWSRSRRTRPCNRSVTRSARSSSAARLRSGRSRSWTRRRRSPNPQTHSRLPPTRASSSGTSGSATTCDRPRSWTT